MTGRLMVVGQPASEQTNFPPELGSRIAAAAMMCASRFEAGATLWCLAPAWPEHARHVAVEFVHPVILGKRALPSVAINVQDPVASLRSIVRSGDLVLVIGTADDESIIDALRRAPAWGVRTIWLGYGAPPDEHLADFSLWLPSADATAPYDGSLVLLYHLLWELTHVCIEHQNELDELAHSIDDRCITCSDEGRVAEVVSVSGTEAAVRTARGIERIDIGLVAPVEVNDLVLVHAGIALTSIRAPR
ncbi:MAG: HypC/HybG/HupF family hydrogenase formation chaperone [Acidimicrobiales bacterium]